MSELTTASQIEAILFYKNEPVKIEELARILNLNQEETRDALLKLEQSLINRGISLINNQNEVSLTTSIQTKELIDSLRKEELNKDIGKAGLETLAIVLYNEGVSRREIDYIRGVNSYFVLRNLTIRGLIEKYQEKEARIPKYRPTLKLMAHLGITKKEELPNFQKFKEEISKIEKSDENE